MNVILLNTIAAIFPSQLVNANPISYLKQLSTMEVESIASWTPFSKQQIWELSGQYEGDMVFARGQKNGVLNTDLHWPDKQIPFELSDNFTEAEKHLITEAVQKEYSKTCIKIRPKTNEDLDFIYVTANNTGCWSKVGRAGGIQELNLQKKGCLQHGIIVHEFLHAAGFYHQQSATNRDEYVEIMWKNIQPGREHNFKKYDDDVISNYGEKYDYSSIMHYSMYAFSFNNEPTIVPKDSTAKIGQRDGLSSTDITKLHKMYNCT